MHRYLFSKGRLEEREASALLLGCTPSISSLYVPAEPLYSKAYTHVVPRATEGSVGKGVCVECLLTRDTLRVVVVGGLVDSNPMGKEEEQNEMACLQADITQMA